MADKVKDIMSPILQVGAVYIRHSQLSFGQNHKSCTVDYADYGTFR